MKKLSDYLIVLLLGMTMISLTGCGKGNTEGQVDTAVAEESISQEETVKEEVMPEGTRATKEFIMEEYQFTEEDIEGIDLEAILDFYYITEEMFTSQNWDMQEHLNYLQKSMERDKNEKLYLIKGTSFAGEKLDVSTLRYLAYIKGEFDMSYVRLIDVEQKEKTWGENGEHYLEYYPKYVESKYTLTEAEIAGLIQVLEKNEVWNWKAEYRSEQEQQITDWGWWKIGMEFADGTIITVWGSIISDEKSKPEWYDEVVEYIGKMGTEVK